VVDTNVLISALLWQGNPGKIFELAGDGDIQIITSRVLLDELAATLAKPKLARFVDATGLSAADMLRNYRRIASTVAAKPLAQAVSRDRDDDAVLACALAARAEVIVTGDDDLLTPFHASCHRAFRLLFPSEWVSLQDEFFQNLRTGCLAANA
jgi:putative PIN family toxin of toxin-antitoxin system